MLRFALTAGLLCWSCSQPPPVNQVPTPDGGTEIEVEVDTWNRAFLTPARYSPGAFGDGAGGLGAADRLCNDDAVARGIEGQFIAYLSTSTRDARDRIPPGVRGWAVEGRAGLFVDDWSSLRVRRPLSDSGAPVLFATGSTGWGTSVGDNCDDWTSGDASFSYRAGNSSEGFPGLESAASKPCSEPTPLLCLEVLNANPPAPGPVRLEVTAFITEGLYGPGGGVQAFDDACAAEAARAGRDGEFLAAVATLSDSAVGRTDHDTYFRWTRADGLALRPSTGLLQLTADDRVVLAAAAGLPSVARALAGEARVWTGAPAGHAVGTETCGDWGSTGGMGRVAFAHQQSWQGELAPCTEQLRLFCLRR